MKQFVLLLIGALALYGWWVSLPRPSRGRIKSGIRRHARPITTIVLILLAGLVYAFFTRSINIL